MTKNDFKPIPEGDYLVRLLDDHLEEVSTKAGNGKMLKATFEIVQAEDETLKGRRIFESFLVEHANPKAAEIGNQRLDKYLKAVGAGGLEENGNDRSVVYSNTQIPFIAGIKVDKGTEYTDKVTGQTKVGKDRNKISSFKAR